MPEGHSIYGRRLAVGLQNQLLSGGLEISRPCADAVITLAAPISTNRAITIQLKDSAGKDIDYVETVELVMFLNAARTAFVVTGGSTGIVIGADGALLAMVAKKVFLATSEADGRIDLTWTDTTSEVAFLGVRLPNGRIVISAALTI